MLKIRLTRTGRTNDASYRLIVTPHTNKPKTHKAVEVLGNLDAKKGIYMLNQDRIKYWLSVGAKVSPTVNNMLVDKGIISGTKQKSQNKMKKKEGKKK
jgi:ribosomal protein S16